MTINELNAHIIDWAKERELDTKGTVEAQAIKTVEELSELIKAICKNKKEDIIDSIGDVYVTLVIGNMLYTQEDLEEIYDFVNDGYNIMIDFTKEDILTNLATSIYHSLEVKYSYLNLYEILQNLLIISNMYDFGFIECVETAYNTIKDRKGKIVNGTYVKDEDLQNEITDIFFGCPTNANH